MKSKNLIISFLIVLASFLIFLSFICFSKGLRKPEEVKVLETKPLIIKDADIFKIVKDFKDNNDTISEYDINDEFIAFIVSNEEKLNTRILNFKTGEEEDIEFIFKKDRYSEFWQKVYELMYLKYPSFIVDTIKSSIGHYYFDIRINEMIIYFDGYVFDPEIDEQISIRVNYNEVKDFLDFKYKLDDSYENENGYDYDPSKKTIAFSFDDGPSGDKTISVVNALLENRAKATFFMVGNKMNNNKSSLLYVFDNDMEIGSHTYSHINMKEKDITVVKNELKKTNEIYHNITGSNITIVRPPYGAYNKNVLTNIDYPLIFWNIDTNDWRYKDTDRIVNHIITNACDGCIVLMHDSYDTTVEAVKKVLPLLYSKGYQVVGISDLARIKGKTLYSHKTYGEIK